MIKPATLKRGDTIAIVSPAGALHDISIIEKSRTLLESWGMKVHIAPHVMTRNGYYSGTAKERISDINACLTDNSIKAILCSYGGYGCVHLLERFAPLIKKYPKWIIGMSDCSALHAACLSQGVMSIHSPQCNHLSKFPDSTPANMLKKILFGEKPLYMNRPHNLDIHGETTGVLAGGNLSVLTALAGSKYDIFRDKTILFIEDTGEPPYKVERMMFQLELSGALSRLNGIIIGEFNGVKEHDRFGGTAYELIHNIIRKHNIPACFKFPVGHCDNNIPLIEGAMATLRIDSNGTELKTNV